MTRPSPSVLRLLLLDDEALVAIYLEDLLTDLGCEVAHVAGTVASALEFLDGGEPIDAAILDVNLGRDTAYPVAAVLTDRRIPFAFATGYGSRGLREGFAGVPVVDKPFAPGALSVLVEEFRRRAAVSP
ncbi:MAG TPA: response regulator [Steroidobacteraceae bacterium]|nr:response regulator [Steroidobacteraceae bacterium]